MQITRGTTAIDPQERDDILDDDIQDVISQVQLTNQGPWNCGCIDGLCLPLIPYFRNGYWRFRRVSVEDPHDPSCLSIVRYEPQRLDWRALRYPERFEVFCRRLFDTAASMAWARAYQHAQKTRRPTEDDYCSGISDAIEYLRFAGNKDVLTAAREQGLVLNLGVARGISDDGLPLDDFDLLVACAPLGGATRIVFRTWRIPRTIVTDKFCPTISIGNACHLVGIVAKSDGTTPNVAIFKAVECLGVFARVDSWTEVRMADRLAGEMAYRVNDLSLLRRHSKELGLGEFAQRLEYKPDYIVLGPVPTLIEVTSFTGGKVATAHTDRVLARLRHFLAVGAPLVEVWKETSGELELIARISTWADYEALRSARSIHF